MDKEIPHNYAIGYIYAWKYFSIVRETAGQKRWHLISPIAKTGFGGSTTHRYGISNDESICRSYSMLMREALLMSFIKTHGTRATTQMMDGIVDVQVKATYTKAFNEAVSCGDIDPKTVKILEDHLTSPVPALGCRCGFYSSNSLKVLNEDYQLRRNADAFGVVRIWGRVVKHERGFRSQYVEPIRLFSAPGLFIQHRDARPSLIKQRQGRRYNRKLYEEVAEDFSVLYPNLVMSHIHSISEIIEKKSELAELYPNAVRVPASEMVLEVKAEENNG